MSKSRLENRADGELKIVEAIAHMLEDQLDLRENELEVLLSRLDRASAEYVERVGAGEQGRAIEQLGKALDKLEKEASLKQIHVDLLDAAHDAISDLLRHLEIIFDLKWFKPLIRAVPEKKMANLVKMEHDDDLTKIQQLAKDVLEKIKNKAARTKQDKMRYERAVKEMEDRYNHMAGVAQQSGANDELRQQRLARAQARVFGGAVVQNPVPVNATAAPTEVSATANAAQNKA